MGRDAKDMTGVKVGYLLVVKEAGAINKARHWLCQCDCGNPVVTDGRKLREYAKKGYSPSCGCRKGYGNRTHGLSTHPLRSVWNHMIQRCYNPNRSCYPRYGGRGITVCERWWQFEGFWKDMRPSYKPGLTLERINNEAGYFPANCRWATVREQNRNRRDNRWVKTANGALTIADYADSTGLPRSTVQARLNRGDLEEAE